MLNRTEAARRKPNQQPPGNYCHCACSRLHSSMAMLRQRSDPRSRRSLIARRAFRSLTRESCKTAKLTL
jgi:hypothetical protein